MLDLVLFFVLLSLLSVGGMSAVMPEVQRVVVDVQHWATPQEFVQLLAIAQVGVLVSGCNRCLGPLLASMDH